MTISSNIKGKRPLSPHLQVYKLPYNALMSIVGRAVGVGLSKGVSILLLWVIVIAWCPESFETSMSFLRLPAIGYILLLAAFAIFFYIGNGVRHVLWDFVIGVHHKDGKCTGNFVLILSAVLTAVLWFLGAGF